MDEYTINVAGNSSWPHSGRHICRITLPLGTTQSEAIAFTRDCEAHWTKGNGFQLTLTSKRTVQTHIIHGNEG